MGHSYSSKNKPLSFTHYPLHIHKASHPQLQHNLSNPNSDGHIKCDSGTKLSLYRYNLAQWIRYVLLPRMRPVQCVATHNTYLLCCDTNLTTVMLFVILIYSLIGIHYCKQLQCNSNDENVIWNVESDPMAFRNSNVSVPNWAVKNALIKQNKSSDSYIVATC